MKNRFQNLPFKFQLAALQSGLGAKVSFSGWGTGGGGGGGESAAAAQTESIKAKYGHGKTSSPPDKAGVADSGNAHASAERHPKSDAIAAKYGKGGGVASNGGGGAGAGAGAEAGVVVGGALGWVSGLGSGWGLGVGGGGVGGGGSGAPGGADASAQTTSLPALRAADQIAAKYSKGPKLSDGDAVAVAAAAAKTSLAAVASHPVVKRKSDAIAATYGKNKQGKSDE
jgi:hypothetical protein